MKIGIKDREGTEISCGDLVETQYYYRVSPNSYNADQKKFRLRGRVELFVENNEFFPVAYFGIKIDPKERKGLYSVGGDFYDCRVIEGASDE